MRADGIYRQTCTWLRQRSMCSVEDAAGRQRVDCTLQILANDAQVTLIRRREAAHDWATCPTALDLREICSRGIPTQRHRGRSYCSSLFVFVLRLISAILKQSVEIAPRNRGSQCEPLARGAYRHYRESQRRATRGPRVYFAFDPSFTCSHSTTPPLDFFSPLYTSFSPKTPSTPFLVYLVHPGSTRTMHSAIEMTPSRSGRVHEESEAPASEISYHSQDSRAPLGHQFPPQGPNRSHTSPGASFRPSFSDPPLSRSVGGGGPQPRQSSPYSNNEKARFNYASSSRPSSPATGRPARSTYGQIPGAAQSDPNLVFAEGDMGKVSRSLFCRHSSPSLT